MNIVESKKEELFDKTLSGVAMKKSLLNQLDILPETRMLVIDEPQNYFKLLSDIPLDTQVVIDKNAINLDLIHYFVDDFEVLNVELVKLKEQIYQNGCIWVSFPIRLSEDFSVEKMEKLALKNELAIIKKIEFDLEFLAYKFCFKVKENKFKDLLEQL